MQVVAHDRVGVDADGKDLAEPVNTGFDDRFAVLEGFAGIGVDSAKLGASHAAGNAVVGAALAGFEERAPWVGHGGDDRLGNALER